MTFYDLLMEASGALYRAAARHLAALSNAAPPPPTFQIQAGRAESPRWFLLQATEFAPEPLTVANLRKEKAHEELRHLQFIKLMEKDGVVSADLASRARRVWLAVRAASRGR